MFSEQPNKRDEAHPRLCGEYEYVIIPVTCDMGSPPLTRGIYMLPNLSCLPCGLTPAYAGNITTAAGFSAFGQAHLRLRGEYLLASEAILPYLGSPPLTRGILIRVRFRDPFYGLTPPLTRGIFKLLCTYWHNIRLTPAYTGNIIQPQDVGRRTEAHPRIRREYYNKVVGILRNKGSPPHTRGI